MGRKVEKSKRKLAVGMLVESRPDFCMKLGLSARPWCVCRILDLGDNFLFLVPVDSGGNDVASAFFLLQDYGSIKLIMSKPANRLGDYLPGDSVQFLDIIQLADYGVFRKVNVWIPAVIVSGEKNGMVVVEEKRDDYGLFPGLQRIIKVEQLCMADHIGMHVHCRRAVLCFLWFWRRVLTPSGQKDVGRLIAKEIWSSRDYRCWQK